MKKSYLILLFMFLLGIDSSYSQSNLLESVKKNPKNAIEMCNKFKELNRKGVSANSEEALNYVSKRNKLDEVNAEILSIYVIGLHCPNVI
tara:strand:- start:370 stop:639 length:270 start_codon:yes stop_codon:yes gene_type:complete